MKALMFDRLGLPADVVSLRDVARPGPGAGEVLVKVLLSPIIPGDSLFTQGFYPEPVRPDLPGEGAGNYGVGIVESVGAGVDLARGSLVAITHRGLWADYAVAPLAKVIPLPDGFRPELGAEFMNLITAWDLLKRSQVHKGQWLVVTAGHATVTTILSQFARAVGVKVLAIVRARRATMDPLAFGAEAVLSLDEESDIRKRVLEMTEGGTHGIVDCVGGDLLGALAGTLRFGSRIVIYGGFDSRPFSMHNLDVLLNGLEIRSYVYRYFFHGPQSADYVHIRQVLALSSDIGIKIPVAGRYTLDRFDEAFARHEGGGRIYFEPSSVEEPGISSG